jgi:hypothetical protein
MFSFLAAIATDLAREVAMAALGAVCAFAINYCSSFFS